MMASCCGNQQAKDGQRLFVGDDIAVTQTQYGLVQGYILDDVYTYLGIPYGAPTGGGKEPRGVSDQMSAALVAFMRTAPKE